MGVIPLTDVSRRPIRIPVVTAGIILVNAVVFALELAGGEPFITKWALVPADIAAGRNLITIVTSMFMHGGATSPSTCWVDWLRLPPR
jgi:membrane associated rhomboid family serine protease